jgi:hypothetical protein
LGVTQIERVNERQRGWRELATMTGIRICRETPILGPPPPTPVALILERSHREW